MTSFCLSIAKFFLGEGPLPFQSQLFLQKHQCQNIEPLNTQYYMQVVHKTYATHGKKLKACPVPTLASLQPSLFICFKKLLQLKINILSSIYSEINVATESVVKINKLS